MSAEGFLLTPENLPGYLTSQKLIEEGENCSVRELGGGVSNIVLMIEWPGQPERRWVAKQSLGKLRVRDEWLSDRERIFRETDAIRMLRPILGRALPEVIHFDRKNFVYIMTAAPRGSLVWKESLLGCRPSELGVACEVGLLLARLINGTGGSPKFALGFHDRTCFDQLRIDPYYRTTASRHPDMATALGRLIADSLQIRTSIVHGDFSPKNILVHGKDIFLIDFEVVHWGDPSFDAGFLLNHLFLKAFHRPQFAQAYLDAAREFWKPLRVGLGADGIQDFELMTIRHLGGLMLARIDGKSPVEYIRAEETKDQLRRVAKSILLEPPSNMERVIEWMSKELRAR